MRTAVFPLVEIDHPVDVTKCHTHTHTSFITTVIETFSGTEVVTIDYCTDMNLKLHSC